MRHDEYDVEIAKSVSYSRVAMDPSYFNNQN